MKDEELRRSLCDDAQALVKLVQPRLAPGMRAVVVVTPEDGSWVGVSSNTHFGDVQRILSCAMSGDDLEFHRREEKAAGEP